LLSPYPQLYSSLFALARRGYAKLYAEQSLGADQGCDFKFMLLD
jgi:hypothetical protein